MSDIRSLMLRAEPILKFGDRRAPLRYTQVVPLSSSPYRLSTLPTGARLVSTELADRPSTTMAIMFKPGSLYDAFAPACAAALRRQSRHRQSSPSTGIGRRAISSAHQHGPAGLQANSVPHREQARRREGWISNRFVMNRTETSPRFSRLVHSLRRYSSRVLYARRSPRKDQREFRWRAIRKLLWLRSIASDLARAAVRRAI